MADMKYHLAHDCDDRWERRRQVGRDVAIDRVCDGKVVTHLEQALSTCSTIREVWAFTTNGDVVKVTR